MNNPGKTVEKATEVISDQAALEHLNKLNRRIKIKNTWIIVLLILLIAIVGYCVLFYLSIDSFLNNNK